MIKVEVIEYFTLKDFDKLENIVRKDRDEYGKLYIGDTFECDEEMLAYLSGNNKYKRAYVKFLDVISKEEKVELELNLNEEKFNDEIKKMKENGKTEKEALEEVGKILDKIVEVKPKTAKKKKTSKK